MTIPSILGSSIQSTVVGSDGSIFCATSNSTFSVKNGKIQWTFPFAPLYSSPVLGPTGTLFIGIGYFNVFALDAMTGDLLWEYAIPDWSVMALEPTDDNVLYVSGNALFALNGSDGTLLWSIPGLVTHSAPAIGADGTLYLARFGLLVLNPRTLQEDWLAPEVSVQYSPAAAPDGAVVTSSDKLVAVDGSDGTLIWEKVLNGYLFDIPAIATDGTIFVGGSSIWAYNGVTGRYLWQPALLLGHSKRLPSAQMVQCTLTLVDMYVRSILSLGKSSGLARWVGQIIPSPPSAPMVP